MPDSFSRIQGNIFHLLKVSEPAGHHRGDLLFFRRRVRRWLDAPVQSEQRILALGHFRKDMPVPLNHIFEKVSLSRQVAALSRFQQARKPGNGHSPRG
jgi:hypothetical protein